MTDHIHIDTDEAGRLVIDAVGALHLSSDDRGLYRMVVMTEHGEELVLIAPAVWLDLHMTPPAGDAVAVITDPFDPGLFALDGGGGRDD
mgnify:FL=1